MIIDQTATLFEDFISDLSGDWRIDFDDLNTNVHYDLDIDENIIILPSFGLKPEQALSSHYFRPQILIGLVEALRMVRHVEWLEGALSQYNPETILLIGRICVADTSAHLIKTAHQMKTHYDDNSLWKHLLCGEWSDMAQAYATSLDQLQKDTTLNIDKAQSKAMATAFNRWFASQDRIKDCDHDTLNLIDGMIAEKTLFENKLLARNAITCLTLESGDQSTYLSADLQDDILKNPYYRSINDPINETHFMQIMSDMNSHRVGGLVFRDPLLAARFTDVEAVC